MDRGSSSAPWETRESKASASSEARDGTSRNPLVVGRVIGDVLDHFTPSIPFIVSYGNREVRNAVVLKPSQVVNSPKVTIGGNDFRNLYTLVVVDPDSPSPSDPNMKEYFHRLVTDIPETTGATFGQVIVSYESPQPMVGIHRFIFMLFRKSGKLSIEAPGWRCKAQLLAIASTSHNLLL